MLVDAPGILTHDQIEAAALPLDACFDAIESAFREHARGRSEMPPKVGVHPAANSFLHAMPASLPGLGLCGMKWVSGFPRNAERGLPTIAGLVVLNNSNTGFPQAILDARWITAMRTAVVSSLFRRAFGDPTGHSAGLAGCGVQGRFHLRCLLHIRHDLEEVHLYDLVREKAEALRHEAAGWTTARIKVAGSPDSCLKGRSLCITCTSGDALRAKDDWLPPGGTAVGVDSHVAWTDLFSRIDKFIVDDLAQCRSFEGQGKYRGPLPPVHAELGDVLAGLAPGRTNKDERILSLPLGLAIADIALARAVLDRVQSPAALPI